MQQPDSSPPGPWILVNCHDTSEGSVFPRLRTVEPRIASGARNKRYALVRTGSGTLANSKLRLFGATGPSTYSPQFTFGDNNADGNNPRGLRSLLRTKLIALMFLAAPYTPSAGLPYRFGTVPTCLLYVLYQPNTRTGFPINTTQFARIDLRLPTQPYRSLSPYRRIFSRKIPFGYIPHSALLSASTTGWG